jgi:integrase/recombinase XerD
VSASEAGSDPDSPVIPHSICYAGAEIALPDRISGDVATRAIPVRQQIAARWLLAQERENTRAAYRRDIHDYFTWCDEFGIDTIAATSHDLRGYRRFLETGGAGRPYVATTVHRKLTSVSSFYRFATFEFDHIVSINPLTNVRRPKIANESTTVGLDLEELQRLLAVADETGPWEAAFVRMLFYSGARISEICNARTADMRTERGHRTIWVSRKGGKRFRLTVSDVAAAALDTHLAGRTGPLFLGNGGGPLSRHEASYRLSKLVRRAQIAKTITPHSIRHTAATLALDAGEDIREVQRMLGHEKIETTLRYDRSRTSVDRSPTHALARTVEGAP